MAASYPPLSKAKIDVIVQLLAEQRSVRDTARWVQVHQSDVEMVSHLFANEIAHAKDRLVKKMFRVLTHALNKLNGV